MTYSSTFSVSYFRGRFTVSEGLICLFSIRLINEHVYPRHTISLYGVASTGFA